jgi:hypothetical protein
MKTKLPFLPFFTTAAIAALLLTGCKQEPQYSESDQEKESREGLEAYAAEMEGGGGGGFRGGGGERGGEEGGGRGGFDRGGGSPEIAMPADGEKVSFVKHVAPILLTQCGRCHIEDNKGELDFKTYATLIKGTPDGPVITAGKPDDSAFITLLEDGEMPPRGDPVDAKYIKVLRDWVAQGSTFEGADKDAMLTSMVPEGMRSGGGGRGGPGGGGRGGFPNPMDSDKNKDGKLARDEVSGFMAQRFDRIDDDKDGFITEAELQAMRERFRAGRGAGGGGDETSGTDVNADPEKQ